MSIARKIATLIATTIGCVLLACESPAPVVEDSISFFQNPLVVECGIDSYDCGLTTSGAWKASSSESWITVLTPSGEKGDALTIRVSANKEEDDRIGAVKVTVGSLTKSLSVSQEGDSSVGFVSSDNVSFSSVAEKQTVTVASTSGWEITSTEGEWFVAEKANNITLAITSEVNFSGASRTGKVVVTSGDGAKSATINLTQIYTNDLFLASTVYGRKLVYNSGGFFHSVSADSYVELTDGVNYFTMTATWKDVVEGATESQAKQRKLFLFEVELDEQTTIGVTLPDDSNNNHSGAVQVMSEQLAKYQSNHSDQTIWGAINGDFFDKTTYTPQGVVYRNGECLKDGFNDNINTVFAIMDDGTAQCLTQSEYESRKGDILEAIGGRQQLLQNGSIVTFGNCPLEPRTAVGVSKDGKKVFLLVVDGRHENYNTGSYGAAYSSLARILITAGAHEAINLDGGGSSTFITRSNDQLRVINKPSNAGNAERAIVNGLAIIRK